MVTFAPYPIPVITPHGEGYVLYVESNSTWENDCVTVALCDGGQWRHYTTAEIKAHANGTYGIKAQKMDFEETKKS